MKRKTITIIAMMLVGSMMTAYLTGCGTKAEATNKEVSDMQEETIIAGGDKESTVDEEIIVNGTEEHDENEEAGFTGNEDIVIYEQAQGVSEEVDRSNLTIMEPAIELHFYADTDVYDIEGNLVGYAKEGAYISFNDYNDKWSSFEIDGITMLMKMEDLQQNAVNEAVAANTHQETPALAEDVTDGNIVLYGGEKKPIKYGGINEGIGEEVNIVLENVEDDVPLYSGEGRLCGYLKKGGSIEITEHCSVMTAWYRFKNPIEGTGYDYLYVKEFETVMSSDIKAYIEEVLTRDDRAKVLDAPEADMECYEFSVPREDYHDLNFLYSDEFDATQYRTFYIECTRNGDFFDYKVYYK